VKTAAQLRELISQGREIVNLAVVDDGVPTVGGGHWLAPAGKINNG
jgi:hypothetical protein